MGAYSLHPIPHNPTLRDLEAALAEARQALTKAEAELAAEQAAVNRFRMHCRLKIGEWVEEVVELRSRKQALLTHLQLMAQADESGAPHDADDVFWQRIEEIARADADGVLLPTDTPNDKAAEKRLYRELAKRFHPDRATGGFERAYATTIMAAVNRAYQERDIDALRDLAGETNPADLAALGNGPTLQERKLHQAVLNCRRRLRKVARQYQSLREENTARLWRRAHQLEAAGLNWWDEVRHELSAEATRLRGDIDVLTQQVATLNRDQRRPAP